MESYCCVEMEFQIHALETVLEIARQCGCSQCHKLYNFKKD